MDEFKSGSLGFGLLDIAEVDQEGRPFPPDDDRAR